VSSARLPHPFTGTVDTSGLGYGDAAEVKKAQVRVAMGRQ
jgi:hypothetical protein